MPLHLVNKHNQNCPHSLNKHSQIRLRSDNRLSKELKLRHLVSKHSKIKNQTPLLRDRVSNLLLRRALSVVRHRPNRLYLANQVHRHLLHRRSELNPRTLRHKQRIHSLKLRLQRQAQQQPRLGLVYKVKLLLPSHSRRPSNHNRVRPLHSKAGLSRHLRMDQLIPRTDSRKASLRSTKVNRVESWRRSTGV